MQNRRLPKVKKLTPAQQVTLDAALAHNRAHQFVRAPQDVLKSVIGKRPELAFKDISHLAQTCARFYTLFQPIVDQAAIKKLLQHIAYGEQVAAEKMITANPRLLMLSGDVIDYSGRKILDVTPLQLAFGGDDEEMCAMLKTKLSAEEFAKQIADKFPENLDAEQKEMEEFGVLMKQLVTAISDPHANILNEINHVANESPLRILLDNFRVKFAPGEVRSGKHFNPQFLLKAFEIYDANYDPWDADRCRLFWSQVVGYLERLLPVSYVQAICQGIGTVVNGEPLKRQLTLADNTAYFPLDANPANRLGFDHGMCFSALATAARADVGGVIGIRRRDFKAYVEQKLQACRIMRPHREEKTSRCVVC